MDSSGNKTLLNYITVGKIINSFGKSGQAKIVALTDFPERFFSPKEEFFLFPPSNGEPVKINLRNAFWHKGFIIANIPGCGSMDDVEKIMNSEIKIKEANLKKLEENSYYLFDIIGLEVVDENGNLIGKIKDVITQTANDIYVITKKDNKELLIPAIGRYIKKVDMENKKMTIIEPEYD